MGYHFESLKGTSMPTEMSLPKEMPMARLQSMVSYQHHSGSGHSCRMLEMAKKSAQKAIKLDSWMG